jgi:four helix bundle protein
MNMAYGSISELETQLFLCRDLYKIDISESISLLTEVSKMLRVIINKLENSN